MIALGKLLEMIGYKTDYYLDKKYAMMFEEELNVIYSGQETTNAYSLIFFQNPSIDNHKYVSYFMKSGFTTRFFYIYHEPQDSLQNLLKEGIVGGFKSLLAHYFSVKLLKKVDGVIVPSEYAAQLYRSHDVKYNKNVFVVPLLFDDEMNEKNQSLEREFFSYIGTAAKAHNYSAFLVFVRKAFEMNLDMRFLIATKSSVKSEILNDPVLKQMLSEKRLVLISDRPLTNSEINECYSRSYCNWNIYSRSTQSGVLPKAFMFGTPVLASSNGSFPEFVKPSCNGEFVANRFCFEEILSKVLHIKENFPKYSRNARKSFMETFYFQANVKKFEAMINE